MQSGAPWRLHTGWLQVGDYAWERHWCVLTRDALVLYVDDDCENEVGQIALPRAVKVINFADQGAPDFFRIMQSERTFGFALFVGDVKDLSEDMDIPCFNAQAEDELHRWMQALRDLALELGSPEVSAKKAEECFIDDFSDYEDEDHAPKPSLAERRSSVELLDTIDWTMGQGYRKSSKGSTSSRQTSGSQNSCPVQRVQPEETARPNIGARPPAVTAEIDGFSDYEDDEHERRSSLVDMVNSDWSKFRHEGHSNRSSQASVLSDERSLKRNSGVESVSDDARNRTASSSVEEAPDEEYYEDPYETW